MDRHTHTPEEKLTAIDCRLELLTERTDRLHEEIGDLKRRLGGNGHPSLASQIASNRGRIDTIQSLLMWICAIIATLFVALVRAVFF